MAAPSASRVDSPGSVVRGVGVGASGIADEWIHPPSATAARYTRVQFSRVAVWCAAAALALVAVFLIHGMAEADGARHGWLHLLTELGIACVAAAGGIGAALGRLNRDHRQFVETMARALDARDPYTAGHSTRVADYSRAIAQAMGLSPGTVQLIGEAAELHDIGKMGIPDAVLQKPGPLTAAEVGLIRLHPQIGCRILEKTGQFQKLLPVVELHHENWDGTGYPYGFRGENVPIEARIVHVADAFDAMTSARCYRAAPSLDWALAELRRCANKQFDPRVTEVFLTLMDEGVFNATLDSAVSSPLFAPATAPAVNAAPMNTASMNVAPMNTPAVSAQVWSETPGHSRSIAGIRR